MAGNLDDLEGPRAGAALDAVSDAVHGIQDRTPASLARCTDALVGAGVAGAAGLIRFGGAQPELVVATGALPGGALEAAARAGRSGAAVSACGAIALPLRSADVEPLVLVVAGVGDPPALVVARSAARLLELRLELVDARRSLKAARAATDTLMSATQALGRSLELRDVLAAILQQLRLVVPYDSCAVQRLDGDVLTIIGGHGFPNLDEIISVSFDLRAEHTPNLEVVRTGRPSILADASATYPTFRQGVHRPASIRGWLGVPLVYGDRLLGMLSIDSREPDFYDHEHAQVAQAFAAQAAIAIENARLFDDMRRMATHDPLTGLPNRRHLQDVGAEVVRRGQAEGRPVAVLMGDLDRFKVVNDTHGHAVGDEVLREVAARFDAHLRPGDLVSRHGGEEFVVLLPDTDGATAMDVGERLRQVVAETPVTTAAGPLQVTISIGVAWRAPVDVPLSDLLHQADHALYAAKAQGRDRVVGA